MASSDEVKEIWRKDKGFLYLLGLSPEKVEDMDKCGDDLLMMEKREERMD